MSKQGNKQNVIDDAARMGFQQRRLPPDYRRLEWTLQCSKCPRTLTAHWEVNMKPEAMARHARVRKWDCGYGMRPLCPDCLHSGDKGPMPKPDNQSFDRFMPPPTAVFDALLDAANRRSIRKLVPELIEKVAEHNAQVVVLRQEKREANAAMDEADKLDAMRSRAAHAREMRQQRLAHHKALLERRKAEIDRASLQEQAPASETSPEEQAPQVENAPQAEEEVMQMSTPAPTPSPKISHAVFQMLDDVFDAQKRLYKNGYTDQRVAKECGTSDQVVAWLRNETFGQLAEDPRLTSLRDDLELLRLESAECFARLQKDIAAAQSRLEQLAHR